MNLHQINNFQIELFPYTNSIKFKITQLDSNIIYESDLEITTLRKNKLLFSSSSVETMIDFLKELILNKNVEIKEENNIIKLTFISTLYTIPNVDLYIYKKNEDLSKEKDEERKNENEIILDLKNKINVIINKEIQVIEEMNNLNKEIIEQKKIINNLNKKLNELNELNNDFRISRLKNKKMNFSKIINNKEQIYSISIFPSGKILIISNDIIIRIFDNNFNIIQIIEKAHLKVIMYCDIKNEENFCTCSLDKNIKTWIKKENKFIQNKILENAHDDIIRKVLYYSEEKIISCSFDFSVKIWEEKKYNYIILKILKHNDKVNSILLLNNILISSGEDGTKFWNLKDYNLIFNINETFCGSWNALSNIDNDKIIVQGKNTNCLKVISINEKKIILNIEFDFPVWTIFYSKIHNLIFIGGNCNHIFIYNSNLELINVIENAHDNDINGFNILNDESIISYSDDRTVKIWKI